MKKTTIIIVAVIFLLQFVPNSFAAETIVTLDFPEDLSEKGESFDVIIRIGNNTGFSAVNFTLSYDKDKLECSKISAGDILKTSLHFSNPANADGATFAAAAINDVYEDGELVKFTFEVKSKFAYSDIKLINSELNSPDGKTISFQTVYNFTEKYEDDDLISQYENKNEAIENGIHEPDTTSEQPLSSQSQTFFDIEGHWGEKYILNVVALGLFKGYPNGNFGPDDNVTRGQFVVTLYRYSGSPQVTVQTPFTDISDQSEEFKNAIAWAFEKGIINGTSATSFAPNALIQRQEAVKILYAYAGVPKIANDQNVASYNRQYGDSDFTLTSSVTDAGTGTGAWTWTSSDPTVLSVVGSGSSATVSILKAGGATVTAEYESDNTKGSAVTAEITVNKATVTVTAKNQSIYVNGTIPDLSSPVKGTHYDVTGLKDGESLGGTLVLEYQKDGSVVTPDKTKSGTYDIVASGAAVPNADNYESEITYISGQLTISSRPIVVVTPTTYTLTFNANGGSNIDSITDDRGTTVDLSKFAPTRDGYTFGGWYSDEALTAAVTSVTLNGNTTVYAKWTEDIFENPFTDVEEESFYYDAVEWAVKNGITEGTSDTTFTPNGVCTRAQMVTFLWRAAGRPEPKTVENPFNDIDLRYAGVPRIALLSFHPNLSRLFYLYN